MKIVIDTNALIKVIPSKSPYHSILQHIRKQHFTLIISNEVLLEYEEIITRQSSAAVAANIVSLVLNLTKLIFVDPSFNWSLITRDPDDNKFVDAAIAGGADFIVTDDKDFKVLASVDFPKYMS